MVGEILLLKGHTSGGSACLFLNLILTLTAAAPHSLYKTWLIVNGIHKLIPFCSSIGMSLSVSSGLFQHILLNGFKQFTGLCLQLVQANNCLFVGISAHQNGLILLHIP